MVRLRHVTLALLGVLVVFAPAAAVAGDPIYRHSGSVVSVERGAIVLAEVGPWKVQNGQTVMTERWIVVTKATEFVTVQRSKDAASGFPGDFTEEPLVDWELMPGDAVTVECEHRGERMIALKVALLTVTTP